MPASKFSVFTSNKGNIKKNKTGKSNRGRKTLYNLDLVKKTAAYLAKHQGEYLYIQPLADHLNISPRTLQRFMADEIGKPEFCRLFHMADLRIKEEAIVDAKHFKLNGKIADPALAYHLGFQAGQVTTPIKKKLETTSEYSHSPRPYLPPVEEIKPLQISTENPDRRRKRARAFSSMLSGFRDRRGAPKYYIPTVKRF